MQKNRIESLIDKNAIVDKGDGVLEFRGGLVLSDESVMKNGTRYEISSMDTENWDGTVFADHNYGVTSILGNAIGVVKKGKKLVAQGVKFAVEDSALADFVYRMTRSGFVKAVSIGTLGRLDYIDEENRKPGDAWGVYRNSRLIEFSFVGIGNNDNAVINSTAQNVFEDAKAHGLDTRELALFVKSSQTESGSIQQPEPTISSNHKDDDMKFVTIKNGREFAVEVSYKNAAGDDVKTTLAAGGTLDVNEEQKNAVEKQLTDAKAPEAKKEPAAAAQNGLTKEDLEAAVNSAVKPLSDKVEELDQQLFDRSAAEPVFKPMQKQAAAGTDALEGKDWKEITQNQIEAFWNATRKGDAEASKTLAQINEFNKNQLVEAKILSKNALGNTDFGNFVTNPELITEIQGYRSDYSELLGVFTYQETNALEMAWLKRNGDIDMQPVGLEPTVEDADANLKPVSEYGADIERKELEELAAVTPVCTSATIFLAADLLGDVAAGYRNSYDRNLARGIVAALELAAQENSGASIGYTAAGVDTAAERLEQIRLAVYAISQGDGVLVMNEASVGLIWALLVEVGQGGVLTNTVVGGNPVTQLWNKRVVVTPNSLLPTLGSNDYKTYSLDGANVTVNHAIFYANPSNFRGRQNGGLRYDLSTDAAYEQNGVVKSAFQRNEIVLRGSHFRGVAVLDDSRVGAVRAQNIIS